MNTNEPKLECFVSVVLVARNNLALLQAQLNPLQEYLESHFCDYEILIVDQRSDDGTVQAMDEMLKRIPCVRFIELSFRIGGDVATVAGLENSIGDYVVLMDLRTDPFDRIREMVTASIEGSDIVMGVSNMRESLAYRTVRPLASMVLRRIGYSVPRGATGFMSISRRAVNAVMSVGRFHHQFFVRLSKAGYSSEGFAYDLLALPASEKKVSRGSSDLFQMVIYNSTLPLRWMSVLGMMGSGCAFIFAFYSFLTRLFMENVAAGWASSVMFQSFMFMLMFAMLAFFGEYLARLLDDQVGYKDYSVVYEKHSSVLLDEDRHNVLNESSH